MERYNARSFTAPSKNRPQTASMLHAAADSCLRLQTLALSSTWDPNHPEPQRLNSNVSRLSLLESLALYGDWQQGLSHGMTALTRLQQLVLGADSKLLRHPLGTLCCLQTLQVTSPIAVSFGGGHGVWFSDCRVLGRDLHTAANHWPCLMLMLAGMLACAVQRWYFVLE